jgi:hypothetical protein
MKTIYLFISLFILITSCSDVITFEDQVDKIFSEFNNTTPGASVLVFHDKKVLLKRDMV